MNYKLKTMYSKICKHCQIVFNSTAKNTQYCSVDCKKAYLKEHKIPVILSGREIQGMENIDYVVCKLCNHKMEAIQGRHLTCTHGINSKCIDFLFKNKLKCETQH
jgi:hypothetical protein